jgi:hypothetical protein
MARQDGFELASNLTPPNPSVVLRRYVLEPILLLVLSLAVAIAAGIVLHHHFFVRNSLPFYFFGGWIWVGSCAAIAAVGSVVRRLVRHRRFVNLLKGIEDSHPAIVINRIRPSVAQTPRLTLATGDRQSRVRVTSGQEISQLTANTQVRVRPVASRVGPVSLTDTRGRVYLAENLM